MSPEKTLEIPTETIDLFSWDYLKNHYKTQPIIKKYFGEIGAELYINSGREFNKNSKLEYVMNFVREINQIPPHELLDEYYWPSNFEDAKRFIYDRPYYFLFNHNSDEGNQQLEIAQLLLAGDLSVPASLEFDIWCSALDYIHFQNHRAFNESANKLRAGKAALRLYSAKYILEQLGEHKTKKVLSQFFDFNKLAAHAGKLYDFIDIALGELNPVNKFLNQTEPHIVTADELELCDDFCKYPIWISFSPDADSKLIDNILHDKLTDKQLKHYLYTCGESSNLVELYPAIKHILKTTEDKTVFYLAGDILNKIWKNLPDDKVLKSWFEQEVHDIYWKRVGGIWPIEHSQELSSSQNNNTEHNYNLRDFLSVGSCKDLPSILEDSIRWITCLDRTNPELEKYFNNLTKKKFDEIKGRFPLCVQKHVFAIKYGKLSPEKQIEKVFKVFGKNSETTWRYLAHPVTIEEAKTSLETILSKGVIIFNQLFALEQIVLTGNRKGVGEYILQYLVDHFKGWSNQFHDNPEYVISIFTAACTGATEYSELKPLEKLADECKRGELIFYDDKYKEKKYKEIEAALAFANESVKKYNAQRDNLAQNLRKHTEEVAKSY